MPINIFDRTHTQKSLKNFVREECIKHIDTEIDQTHPIYYILYEMIQRHPCFSIGDNDIVSFYLSTKDTKFGETFRPYVQINNTQKQSFSLLKTCITGKCDSTKSMQINAMRSAINPQITTFRQNCDYICATCKKQKTPTECDIDHIIDFKKIATAFIQKHGECKTTKKGIDHIFIDENYTRMWFDYHLKNSVLQCLCKLCHLQKTH